MKKKKSPPAKSGAPSTPTTKKKSKSSRKWRIAKLVLKLGFGCAAIGFIAGVFLISIYSHDLPDINKLYEEKFDRSITITDGQGNIIGSYGDVFTQFMQYDEIPQNLVNAVIATEDRRFFSHIGVDFRGLARAVVVNAVKGGVRQGGSTVTQQLAKIVFLTPERNLKRKVQEAMMAFWLEQKFSKKQIMSMYLNRVYLGSGVYGVDAASRKYFGKSVKDINLYESAILAGMLKAPSTYSPLNNPRASARRAEQVLLNMVDAEKITEKQKAQAILSATKIHLAQARESSKYFADYVADQIEQYIGKTAGNLTVKTSFDSNLQKLADDSVSKNMLELGDKDKASQAAMVVMSPDGSILAMIGGVDYADSQFNRATQAQRQPGSLFKLFVYTAAMENGKYPEDQIEDAPITIDKWKPQNYDKKYHGLVTLREAFAHSYNAAAAALSESVGRAKVIDMAQKLGVKSKLAETASVALGTSEANLLEMTTAFAHFPNNGHSVASHAIDEIKDATGRVLYTRTGEYDIEVLSKDTVQKMNSLMMSVVSGGTAKAANIGRDTAGKTGTSQDYRDAWFVGFTPDLVAGVWVGNDNNKPMKNVTGGSIPTKIWADFMREALADKDAKPIDANYSKGFGDDINNLWDSLGQ